MKKTILSLFVGSFLFSSCSKEEAAFPRPQIEEACILQTVNPAGRSYAEDSVLSYECNSKFCGLLPLSTKNYWIYEDSLFSDGVFLKVQNDTLRLAHTYRTPDGLLWWEGSLDVGLPERMFVNDSAFFKIEDRLFTPGIVDAKKDYALFSGDSIRYLASFEDVAAQGRSLRMGEPFHTPAGTFSDCIYFEKNARNYRRDRIYFKPGVGVLRYVQEKAPMGTREIKLQQISTLVKFHFE